MGWDGAIKKLYKKTQSATLMVNQAILKIGAGHAKSGHIFNISFDKPISRSPVPRCNRFKQI
ncbi:MAG: hypothetical protein A3C71_01570 [Candidatus Yanofskybacteria bacterium RIFCSPHIGHO2_02_FULL_43_15c]|uniref:Uncharacterized protein n=2 Tax=Candidatus Yanofskyibacteriota TaxID=1752733 RepID=A0A1F8H1N1_9BACT|nr:MAG: hypothetical protein A3C71_01570 [Candidatus Yanofskybacteria bacterium RIFCSPHIGHO2_02_FULL_43_15c]OGN31554.1 MAG: hypothetical protein A3I92_01410 [Candidatus Yanofskybacteria bacterium RIFCSPLOWO2_02_FULL_43_10b]